MYCGSCMRDNTLVATIKLLGHDVTMLPLYTPMRVDEESVSEKHVFYGGIEAYFLQQFPQKSFWYEALLRVAGSQSVIRMLPHFDIGSAVDPTQNAELTLSMLRGEFGNQKSLLDEMVSWLSSTLQPELVHITNTLISGPARKLKQALNVPIVCGLHGEDIFINGLPDAYRTQALDLIRENAQYIDHFIAISQYYADYFGDMVGIDLEKISLVRPGIALHDYRALPDSQTSSGPLTIGYLARISPEKGLHILADAFINLCQSGKFPNLRLKAAGYLSRVHVPYVKRIQKRLQQVGLLDKVEIIGTVDRQQKLSFLNSLDVFSLPTVYRDPKGLPVLEALASGVPVVQPNHGAFPELVNSTGGGLLHKPEDPIDLSKKLAMLLQDEQLRRSLNVKGKTAVYNHFSAERMAEETVAIYQKLAR